jgi:hypothetical protein
MGKSGIFNRVEPSSMEQIDASAKELLRRSGFYQFLQKFLGENYGVAMAFAQSFNGQQVSVGLLKFKITESFILEATGLPMAGEKWYKKKIIKIGDFTTFLKPHYSMVDWRCGIPSSWLKEDW